MDSFIITLIPAAQPVVVSNPANQTSTEGDTINLNLSGNFNVPNNDPLTYSMTNAPASLSINANSGIISGTLTASDRSGSPYTVSITSSNGQLFVTATFTWTVNAAPPPPPAPPSSGGGGGSFSISLLCLLLLVSRLKYHLR